ncbi:MAG: AtpZ/AtpI family protein [Planctomycetes bacterium]|nr:AtpZ/AtpI family protein [Planctomycetota bacterium]MCH9726348.1 AtpZ/AtpI family protein [Planctomycetota bacterium]MCH9776349.1 AtpZ/AtpI family protein [Planctomycetota bacterium]MDF1744619.1 AtpZ/AtpI family protein [Gimesia sp.]
MPQPDRQNRSSLAEAHLWVSRLTTVSLEMALPAFFGHWLDKKWDTVPLFTAVGALLGFVCGLTHLLQMAKDAERKEQKSKNQSMKKTDSLPDDDHQTNKN